MTELIECVPNFSEGRDRGVIDAIIAQIRGTPGAELLDVHTGETINRTVVTFVGSPEAVEAAAFRAIRTASELIDMASHRGAHPRIGATDVCPFVPLERALMEDCIVIARSLGRRVGEQLGIPVFLYGAAAARPERRSLADVRKGEYEGLATRTDRPDFGPADLNRRSGATAVGAREFLIAFNVNLNTRDRSAANRIAEALRESGRPLRDEKGTIVRGAGGSALRKPGRFKELRAIGWYLEEYRRAQVSFNLTNHQVTPLHTVFEAARQEAAKLGIRVTGSELVGLVPRHALLAAGDYYLAQQGRPSIVPEPERIQAAVTSLGLEELGPFDPEARIVEYATRTYRQV